MNHIKIIKSHQEHDEALVRLMHLMDCDLSDNSVEADELDVLALLIEQYEQEQYPIDPPDPIEAIKFRMEQQNLKQKDLAQYIGSAAKVSEVLNGTRNLSLNMIRKLTNGLGISAEILIRAPEQKAAMTHDSASIDWTKFPLNAMFKAGYFEGAIENLRELKEYSQEHLTQFLMSIKSGFSLQPTMLRTSAHNRSNDKETDEYALWAWQVKVLQQANIGTLSTTYQPGTINLVWLQKLAQLSWSAKGPLLAKEYLNSHGIHLIFEPHLPKTYLDGAVCLHSGGDPVVALTLRHDRLDNFWFTLMHELAHIALHIDGDDAWFLDDFDAASVDICEQQADDLAQKALLPIDASVLAKLNDASQIRQVAQKLSIHPNIIAGRVRYENKSHKLFGTLFRDKVKDSLKR